MIRARALSLSVCAAAGEKLLSPRLFPLIAHQSISPNERERERDRINTICTSAESNLTLKNRESIHFGHFHDRFYEKNQFMIHELIHISIHVSLLP